MKKTINYLLMGLILMSLVYGAHLVLTSTGTSDFGTVNETVAHQYNFSVNNTFATAEQNITQVNITLPENFTFVASSNGTDAGTHAFTNTSTNLSWANDGLVMNLTTKYFWFNATASYPGTYNFTITTSNITSVVNTTNISVTINDTTYPLIDYAFNTDANNSNVSRRYIIVNVTANDTHSMETINISLYNASSDLINSSTNTTSPFYVNFTVTSDGVYYFNATVNDTAGNTNSTTTRTITVDTTSPVITLIAPATATSSTTDAYNFTFNVTEIYGIASCELVLESTIYQTITTVSNTTTNGMYNSSIPVGTYVWYINCTDEVGNEGNSSTRTLTVSAPATTTTTTSSSSTSNNYVASSSSDDKIVVYAGLKVALPYEDYILEVALGKIGSTVDFTIDGIDYSMAEGDYLEIDVDGDGKNDISIKVEDIRSPYADLVIKEVIVTSQTTPEVEEQTAEPEVEEQIEPIEEIIEEETSLTWLWIVLILIALSVIIYFVLNKKE